MEFSEPSCLFPINNFPGNLWLLVNDPQISSICWSSNGEVILIQEPSFVEEVLQAQEYFKTTDFHSFIRQLNLYGFKKVRPDYDSSYIKIESSYDTSIRQFRSPYFLRDKPELLINLKRLTSANKARLAAGLELTSRSSTRINLPRAVCAYTQTEHGGT